MQAAEVVCAVNEWSMEDFAQHVSWGAKERGKKGWQLVKPPS
jgi:hypothetical protein